MESLKFGNKSLANELNPVASFVLKCSLRFTSEFGLGLVDDLTRWGSEWVESVTSEIQRFYPCQPDEQVLDFILAKTIPCPDTGKEVPLFFNFWLRKSATEPVVLKLSTDSDLDICGFEIVSDEPINFDPNQGTVSRGKAVSPWTGQIIESETIKALAQSGQMGYRLVAVVVKSDGEKKYREPNSEDLFAIKAAEEFLCEHDEDLQSCIPNELFPEDSSDRRPRSYGLEEWNSFFIPRQLLSLAICVKVLNSIRIEIASSVGDGKSKAIVKLIAAVIDKLADYNSKSSFWEPSREVIAHTFARHDFSMKWNFAEMDLVSGNGLAWALDQVIDAYKKICNLIEPTRNVLFPTQSENWSDDVRVTMGDAADLPYETGSVEAVVMDPPYYDNVQYAELSDFFYVWLKRTAGPTCPEMFGSYLSEKDREAVMNPARFVRIDKKRARELARADYERKMVRIFAEANRVLRDDGVLTVMFNHKKVEAWDTLARSLIEGGFQILTSWPVHTESQHSLHQAKKAASASTIMLACRKRLEDEQNGHDVWWEDIKDKLEEEVSQCAIDFYEKGIRGVDLMVAAFGPALSVVSQYWPVLLPETGPSGKPKQLSPDAALDLARKVVVRMLREGLLGGENVTFDAFSDWYVMAWDIFRARSFPFDEGRRLAIVSGLQMDELKRLKLYRKSGSNIELIDPEERYELGAYSIDTGEGLESTSLVDRAYALMVTALTKQLSGVFDMLEQNRMDQDSKLKPYMQALLNAVPRTKKTVEFILPEAKALDTVAAALGLDLPPEPEETPPPPEQKPLL